jgi:hypothetical protein
MRTAIAIATALVVAVGLIGIGRAASRRIPPAYKNCSAVNHRYPHGIGKIGARDLTTGTPVTNFKRSNKLYATAMSFNRGLDRDHDGIACEAA